MSLTRVTDLVDDIEAYQLNQYAELLEGELDSPVSLTALDDETEYALQVGNQDTTNGRALRVLKPNLTDPWIDVTNTGVTIEKLRLRHISSPSAPGSNLMEVYPLNDDRLYFRSGGAGAETKLATDPSTTAGDIAYAASASVLARRGIGTQGFGLAVNPSLLPDYADLRTFSPIRNASFNRWSVATSFTTVADGTVTADGWLYNKSLGTGVHTVARDTSVPSVTANSPLQNYSLLVDCTTSEAAIAAGEYCTISQQLLGFDWLPFAQQAFILSFWVKATKTGTYCVAFRNSGSDRSYVAEYTVSASDTWEYKTVAVSASPSAGTWSYTTGNGLQVIWTLAGGSTYQTTAGSWATGNYFSTSNQVNACDSTSNNFYLSQPRLSLGTVALPFVARPYHLERWLATPLQFGYSTGQTDNPTLTGGSGYATMNGNGTSNELRVDLTTQGGDVLLWLILTAVNSSAAGAIGIAFTIDGASEVGEGAQSWSNGTYAMPMATMYRATGLAAGTSHVFRARWNAITGNGTLYQKARHLIAVEVPANAA